MDKFWKLNKSTRDVQGTLPHTFWNGAQADKREGLECERGIVGEVEGRHWEGAASRKGMLPCLGYEDTWRVSVIFSGLTQDQDQDHVT